MTEAGRRTHRSHQRKGLSHRLFLLLVVLTLAIGAVKVAGPLAAIRRQGEELSQLSSEKAEAQARHESLLQEQRWIASDAGLEMIARRSGYLRAGERRIVFVPPSSQTPASEAPTE